MLKNIGWKTLATAGALVALGAVQLAGVDVSAYTMLSPVDCFLAAAGLVGLRAADAKILGKL